MNAGMFSMSKPAANIFLPIAFALCCLFAISVALFYPGYASDASILGMLIFLEIVLAAIWNYEQRFFLLLILVFFFAAAGILVGGTMVRPWGRHSSGRCAFSQRSPLPSRGISLSRILLPHRGGGFVFCIFISARRIVQGIQFLAFVFLCSIRHARGGAAEGAAVLFRIAIVLRTSHLRGGNLLFRIALRPLRKPELPGCGNGRTCRSDDLMGGLRDRGNISTKTAGCRACVICFAACHQSRTRRNTGCNNLVCSGLYSPASLSSPGIAGLHGVARRGGCGICSFSCYCHRTAIAHISIHLQGTSREWLAWLP